jgi:hypothetical protein
VIVTIAVIIVVIIVVVLCLSLSSQFIFVSMIKKGKGRPRCLEFVTLGVIVGEDPGQARYGSTEEATGDNA